MCWVECELRYGRFAQGIPPDSDSEFPELRLRRIAAMAWLGRKKRALKYREWWWVKAAWDLRDPRHSGDRQSFLSLWRVGNEDVIDPVIRSVFDGLAVCAWLYVCG
jgi:hypothetical protein